jgi:hypothetical protein
MADVNSTSVNRRGLYEAPWSPLLKGVSLAASLVRALGYEVERKEILR